jgi:molecular chaperone GrpE
LQDFRAWLLEAQLPQAGGAEEPEFHWQTLVAEFTALRHEVNLQTRAARAQSDQNAEALKHLDEALAAVEGARPTEQGQPDEALRPLLKTLVDVYDALALARREVVRVQTVVNAALARWEQVPGSAAELVRTDVAHPPATKSRPWWRWWLAAGAGSGESISALRNKIADLERRLARQQESLVQMQRDQSSSQTAGEQVRQLLESILAGYTMGLARIERALAQYAVETIHCVGEPFDPECMEVVEVVTEPGRSGTEVLEEIRRGYHWRGRLFRHALVRVARP